MTVPSESGETVLEVGTFNTHAEFTAGRPNGRVGPAVKMHISVSSAFQTTVKFNPTSTIASIVNPSVVEVSTVDLIPYEASKSIHPMVEVPHCRLCLLRQ